MTKQMVLSKIMARRGYLVLWQAPYHKAYSVGTVVERAGAEGFDLGAPLKVIRATSKYDFLAQQQLSRRLDRRHWPKYSASQQLRDILSKNPEGVKFWRVKRMRQRVSRAIAETPTEITFRFKWGI